MIREMDASPDLILVDGPIYSPGLGGTAPTGLAVKGEAVVAVGDAEEVRAMAGERTRTISLRGRSAIPGIVDSHNHLVTAGSHMVDGILLFDAENIEQLKEGVAHRAAELPPGSWVTGAGWIESQFEEWRMPHRSDLDEAAPDHPVILDRLFAMSAVNTRALEAAGIGRHDPPGMRGTIERDASGEPTGILRDGAQELVRRAMPREDSATRLRRLEEYIETAAREYVRWGITTVLDPGVPPEVMKAYWTAVLDEGLPLGLNAMPVWHGLRPGEERDLDALLDHVGVFTGFGDARLRLGALKMALDGGLGSRSSWMYEPFLDGRRTETPLRFDPDDIDGFFRAATEAGWSIGIHCCGDRAQDVACAAFDGLAAPRLESATRHNVIHGYFPTEYSLEIMARRDIAVSVQPGFIWVEGDLYETVMEREKLAGFKPLRTYLDRGIRVAMNSDMTSAHYNPFWGLHSAVTRETARGSRLGDSQCVDRFEALEMMTLGGAYLCSEEDIKGSLEPGKRADIAVLDRDFGAISDASLRDLTVAATVVGGEIVHGEDEARCEG